MRIYPYAFRVNSSNLDPTFYWRRGAQLVALNWQNLDKGMMLNHGMFVGTHGWRLKPSGYRSSDGPTSVIERRILTLSIEVYAAQDLSLPEGDTSERSFKPYVNCQLHVEEPGDEDTPTPDDASSDEEKSSYRRTTKSSSGRNPDFKGQKLEFPRVVGIVEELSFLRSVFFCFASLLTLNFYRCRIILRVLLRLPSSAALSLTAAFPPSLPRLKPHTPVYAMQGLCLQYDIRQKHVCAHQREHKSIDQDWLLRSFLGRQCIV